MSKAELLKRYEELRRTLNMEDALIVLGRQIAELSFEAGDKYARSVGTIRNRPSKDEFIQSLFKD